MARLKRLWRALLAAWPTPAIQTEIQATIEQPAQETQLGTGTISYLAEIAEDAYDKQDELNESVWRSLPFFAAGLGLAVTLLGRAAMDVPAPMITLYSVSMNALLALSFACFAWAFWWLWLVVRSQDYEYPSDQAEVERYAGEMVQYHSHSGLEGSALDEKVLDELRLFRARQLGAAARTNLANNARKLKARSQLLLFMMIGFLLTIVTEVTTSTHDALFPSQVANEVRP